MRRPGGEPFTGMTFGGEALGGGPLRKDRNNKQIIA